MGGVVWLSVTSFGRRGDKIEANPLWEGTVRVSAQDWQAEIDHGGKEEPGNKSESSEPGTAGPGDPRLPWWLPDPAEGGIALGTAGGHHPVRSCRPTNNGCWRRRA